MRKIVQISASSSPEWKGIVWVNIVALTDDGKVFWTDTSTVDDHGWVELPPIPQDDKSEGEKNESTPSMA